MGSAPVLRRLALFPRWFVPLVLAVSLVAGLLIGSHWAGLLLLAVAVFLGWLLALSWPALKPVGRFTRIAVVVAIAAAAALRLAGVL